MQQIHLPKAVCRGVRVDVHTPPEAVEQALVTLGRNIRTARRHRRLSRQQLAEKVGMSRYLMADIEAGKPTTAMAAYVGVLWALGLRGFG